MASLASVTPMARMALASLDVVASMVWVTDLNGRILCNVMWNFPPLRCSLTKLAWDAEGSESPMASLASVTPMARMALASLDLVVSRIWVTDLNGRILCNVMWNFPPLKTWICCLTKQAWDAEGSESPMASLVSVTPMARMALASLDLVVSMVSVTDLNGRILCNVMWNFQPLKTWICSLTKQAWDAEGSESPMASLASVTPMARMALASLDLVASMVGVTDLHGRILCNVMLNFPPLRCSLTKLAWDAEGSESPMASLASVTPMARMALASLDLVASMVGVTDLHGRILCNVMWNFPPLRCSLTKLAWDAEGSESPMASLASVTPMARMALASLDLVASMVWVTDLNGRILCNVMLNFPPLRCSLTKLAWDAEGSESPMASLASVTPMARMALASLDLVASMVWVTDLNGRILCNVMWNFPPLRCSLTKLAWDAEGSESPMASLASVTPMARMALASLDLVVSRIWVTDLNGRILCNVMWNFPPLKTWIRSLTRQAWDAEGSESPMASLATVTPMARMALASLDLVASMVWVTDLNGRILCNVMWNFPPLICSLTKQAWDAEGSRSSRRVDVAKVKKELMGSQIWSVVVTWASMASMVASMASMVASMASTELMVVSMALMDAPMASLASVAPMTLMALASVALVVSRIWETHLSKRKMSNEMLRFSPMFDEWRCDNDDNDDDDYCNCNYNYICKYK